MKLEMTLDFFLLSLALTLAVVASALIYLRGITRRVLVQMCHGETGAEFWLRAADVLALTGSLLLVLAFGGTLPDASFVTQLRLVLGLAAAGIFVTVVLVASNVWRSIPEAKPEIELRSPS
jgi:exosortase/archaeosortase